MTKLFDNINFDQEELDAMIDEMNIETNLPIDCQRHLASILMISLSLAITISDEKKYKIAIKDLYNDISINEKEIDFFTEFGDLLIMTLTKELNDNKFDTTNFKKRTNLLNNYPVNH